MKVVSPPLGGKVSFVRSYNEFTYVRVRDELLKLKYHHVVKRWKLNASQDGSFLLFDKLIVVMEGTCLTMIDEVTNELNTLKVGFQIKGIVHPVTYVNKLLLYSDDQVILMNIQAGKLLYSYNKFKQMLVDSDCKISAVEASPLVDIVGVGMDNGTIAFLNVRKDQVVFTVRQKIAVTALGFSHEEPWMASGDSNGNIILWDL